ncbi:MAG: helix-turn-helix transcriptional regulator [Lachnospiraceae bacterium]|nr:helix-turn-helix transcriptional regulator [Lachnospiraceae bacterium]
MSYPSSVRAIICYIEAHIKDEKFNYNELERRIGFSNAYIREIFGKNTGCSLAKYVRMRKIKCSAYELLYTDKSILNIAYLYGFSNPETYTRAFQKIAGMTPSTFRSIRPIIGKEELSVGVYGIGLLEEKERRSDIFMDKNVYKSNESTILYGVPKVAHGVYGGNTPYPICLKACCEYLGEDLEYYFTMVSSAAAFRLVWNTECWDLSNVDIFHTLNETNDIYGFGAKVLGREFSFLGRDEGTTKEEFMQFIKEHIDEGYPCIALGIIGPPEPCIITGYRKNGEELLGWNFFQNDPEFAANIEIDESGYFMCSNWWENTDTQAVMCMGAVQREKITDAEIISNAVKVLTGRKEYSYCKGTQAYDAWKNALQQNDEFTVTDNLFVLFEKMLCQMDAMTCITDGRSNAAKYFRKLAETDKTNKEKYIQIADAFTKCASTVEKMWGLFGETSNMEGMLERLADKSVRDEVCKLIDMSEKSDSEALAIMETIIR